ncbi:DNA polymerase III subunit epsilon [Candidatus Rariloculus sp.]|uniref:DNA polymerase III subunit epsilon n=1 Tax=Candidatus Rariloculus sp. TaxID=3101265 RepID=UPI003D11265B
MRQVVLDTETTGLEPAAGHRIIEIGCVELVNRRATGRTFQRYVNPGRTVEAGALEVHGIGDEFLATQPHFGDIAAEFLEFVRGAELVIHNAEFDVGFINHELRRVPDAPGDIGSCCDVLDTLSLARRMHPGQANSLDALAKRYGVDNSRRELHGALLDAQILAEIYLIMTGAQVSLSLDTDDDAAHTDKAEFAPVKRAGLVLTVLRASADEEAAHEAILARIRSQRDGPALWDALPAGGDEP